jgi:hypothetical protein
VHWVFLFVALFPMRISFIFLVRTMFSNSLCCWPQPYYSETKIHTLLNFQLLQSNPNIVSASLQVTHNDQAIHQQKEQLNCINPSTLHHTSTHITPPWHSELHHLQYNSSFHSGDV